MCRLIVRSYVIFCHKFTYRTYNRLIDWCTDKAGRCLYYGMGTSCVETDSNISVLVLSHRELCLISVEERLVHPDNRLHIHICKSAYSSYIFLYHCALKIKLLIIGELLKITASALSCNRTSGGDTVW